MKKLSKFKNQEIDLKKQIQIKGGDGGPYYVPGQGVTKTVFVFKT